MRTVALYEMLFGLLTLVGGIIGYTSAGSWISLAAGGLAGIILIFSALSMQKGSRTGLFVTLIVTLALLGNFGYKLIAGDGRFMPAGMMTILAGISLILLLLLLVQPKERKRIF